MMLKRTQDRKTANLATPNGKQSKIANTFSLPAGREYSCPNATNFCSSICYAGNLERIYKGFRDVVLHNWNMLKDADRNTMINYLTLMIIEFDKECDKWDAPKVFRIHADGDFFNVNYTYAWMYVIKAFPQIQFWAYTRVPNAAVVLHDAKLPNLGLYFSGDRDNIEDANRMKSLGINIAMVAKTFAEAKESFPTATRCPEQTKALAIISENGGACFTCGLCVNGRKDVVFSSSKK